MSWCCYRECPSNCNSSDCNCPCHQDSLEDDNSDNSDDWDSEKMEELCPYDECRRDCFGYSEDCNCPCHQDILEAWYRAEQDAEALAAEIAAAEGNSAKEDNSSSGQSK